MKRFATAGLAARRRGVTRLFSILAAFLMLTMGYASILHAAEPQGAFSVGAAATVFELGHSQNDGDEVPSDGDKGVPHHHGTCHGDHLAAPIKLAALAPRTGLRSVPVGADQRGLPHSTADPALRPPQA